MSRLSAGGPYWLIMDPVALEAGRCEASRIAVAPELSDPGHDTVNDKSKTMQDQVRLRRGGSPSLEVSNSIVTVSLHPPCPALIVDLMSPSWLC